ncbi:hypothetical protein ES703_10474 [subsurface metagenome]
MGLKEAYMIKENMSAATASLSIQAGVGESLLIKQLLVGARHGGGFCECLIDRLSVGFWYIGDLDANHLEQCGVCDVLPNLFERLQDKGIFAGYPIAEGETFEIKPAVQGADIVGAIVYEIHEAGDMAAEMPGGSKADEYMFVNYGTNKSAIVGGAFGDIDMSRNPSEYPAFPFGEVVPAGHEIDIHGVLLKTWGGYVDHTAETMRFLKLIRDRKVLFNEDRRGIYVTQGMGPLTWGSIRQTNCDIKLFPAPLLFGPGDELNMSLSAAVGVTEQDVLLATVQTVRKLGA